MFERYDKINLSVRETNSHMRSMLSEELPLAPPRGASLEMVKDAVQTYHSHILKLHAMIREYSELVILLGWLAGTGWLVAIAMFIFVGLHYAGNH